MKATRFETVCASVVLQPENVPHQRFTEQSIFKQTVVLGHELSAHHCSGRMLICNNTAMISKWGNINCSVEAI